MSGLSDADLIELMENAAGHGLDDDGVRLRAALGRETEGNPFFVSEMLRHLGEIGEIYLDERKRYVLRSSLADLGLPTSVREVVARRVARLGEETERVLAAGAVIGMTSTWTCSGGSSTSTRIGCSKEHLGAGRRGGRAHGVVVGARPVPGPRTR